MSDIDILGVTLLSISMGAYALIWVEEIRSHREWLKDHYSPLSPQEESELEERKEKWRRYLARRSV